MPPERAYDVSQHARDRLAERYRVELADDTWAELVRGIEDWPHEVTDVPRQGTEIRLTHVQVQGPDGTLLVLPIVYLASRWLVRIITVRPNGVRLRRPHAAATP